MSLIDAGVCLFFLLVSVWLFHGLWPFPATRAIASNPNDQALIEWFLSNGVLFWTGDLDLHSLRLNAPDGINLMTNASHLLPAVLLAPVTVLFGPAVSFAVLAVVNLAATAAGWHLLLARGLGLNRVGAAIGGLLTGFAPGMIAQSNSHLHITAQWLVPPMVWSVISLVRAAQRQDRRAAAGWGLGLGALASAQAFLGEEVLYFTALTLLLFSVVYAAARPRLVRDTAALVAGGLAIAVALAAAVLTYPLWMQVAGPLHIPNPVFSAEYFRADVATYVTFSPQSIAGADEAGALSPGRSEENAYFGLPLLLVVAIALTVGIIRWPRRRPTLIAAGAAGLLLAWLSFGPIVYLDNQPTGFPSLYRLIGDIPLVDSALPTRYALAVIPLIALVLAIAIDEAVRRGGLALAAAPAAAVLALVPLIPPPLPTVHRDPVPAFISSGAWRQCVPEGGVLVPVPLPTPTAPDTMRWAAEANNAFALPEGFFIAPYGAGGKASIGVFPRPTSLLLGEVARTGTVPAITDTNRTIAQDDLAFWGASCVALAHVPQEQALRTTLEALLGPGTPILDTWTWPLP